MAEAKNSAPEAQPNQKDFKKKSYYYQGYFVSAAEARKQKEHIELTERRSVIIDEQNTNVHHVWKSEKIDMKFA